MKTIHAASTPDPLAQHLRSRLLALDFPAFARCVCRLMETLGYEDVRLTGRREWKGYNRPGGGGYDLEAVLPGGLTPRRVIAQIKQFEALTVHQRSVDELRGACLRVGAAEAMLVTTSNFSEVVRKRAAAPVPADTLIAPLRLMDGNELVSLLIQHRLGVRERGLGRLRRLEIDEAFFTNIAPPSAPPASRPSSTPGAWRLTLRISSDHISSPQISSPQTLSNTRPKRWRRGRRNGPTEGDR